MSRIRITLMTALVFALAAVAINSQAQPPPGGQRGGRGQRGGGPGGGPGGPGGPGSNLIALAGNDAVQKELKLTERQKAKVKQISDDQIKKRGEVFQQLRQQTDMAKAQAAQQAQAEALQGGQIDPSVDARGSGAGNALAGALNSRGYQPRVYGGRFQGGQVDPALQQQAAQFQGQQAANAVQAQGFQLMREAMQEVQQESEGNLAKVLDKNQVKRLKEIQLQVEGPAAVIREDVAEKLEITEEQHSDIQAILTEANTARRQIMQKNFQLVRSLMPNQPADGNPPAADGQPDANAPAAAAAGGAQGGQAGQPEQAGQPGQGGRGGSGGRGGANGQNRGGFNREAMQKAMEQPEVKAKVDEAREEAQKEQAQLREREYAMVYKAMDRRQVAVFKKMLGKPFDVESVMGAGFMRGSPGGRRNGANGNANQTTAAAKADTAKTTPAASADSSAASTTKPATTPRRQSLRERRGLGGQQPTPESESPN